VTRVAPKWLYLPHDGAAAASGYINDCWVKNYL